MLNPTVTVLKYGVIRILKYFTFYFILYSLQYTSDKLFYLTNTNITFFVSYRYLNIEQIKKSPPFHLIQSLFTTKGVLLIHTTGDNGGDKSYFINDIFKLEIIMNNY